MQLRFTYTALGAALVIALLSSGCELVADFDRSKIPGNNPDSGVTTPPDDDDEEDAGKDAGADAASGNADAG